MVTVLYCALCICVFSAVYTLRLTFGKHQAWFYGAYFAMCLFGSMYLLGTIVHYQITTVEGSAMGLRIQAIGALGYVLSLCWFVYWFAGVRAGEKILKIYSVLIILSAIYACSFEFSFRYSDLDAYRVAELPWGEALGYRLGLPHPLYFWYLSLELFGCVWAIFCAVFSTRKDFSVAKVGLVTYSVVQAVSLFSGSMVGFDQIHYVYLDWVPPVCLFVAMAFYFSDVQVKLSERLSKEVAERIQIAKQLKERVFLDELTALPNHQALVRELDRLIVTGNIKARYLIFVDIIDFKSINHTYGSTSADQVLSELSERLRKSFDGKNYVARQGGDCFALIVDGQYGQKILEERCLPDNQKELGSIYEPFIVGEQAVFLNFSLGVVQLHEDIETSNQAILMAGLAVRESREERKTVCYDAKLTAKVAFDRALELDFAEALRNGALTLSAQPQISASEQIQGIEVLCRWTHEHRGNIPPDVFIPIAEKLGLISKLGWWVLARTCETLLQWDSEGFQISGRVAVNISTLQLKDPSFSTNVLSMLDNYGIKPDRLEFEVTESATLEQEAVAQEQLEKLAKAEIKIAIDDFGTGYSSLSYFNTLPISLLKIDKSFVGNMASSNGAQLINTIVNLASELKLKVLAEGVETKSQFQQLKKMGCNAFQGYLWCEPLPMGQLKGWITSFTESKENFFVQK